MDVRVMTERHILTSALTATLEGMAQVSGLSDPESPEGDILVLELRHWVPERMEQAVRHMTRPVIAWIPVMAADMARCAVENGVRGVLGDLSTAAEIVNCVTVVARGELWLPSDVAAALFTRKVCRLSPRESQLVGLLATGLRNKEIATKMNITEGTVKVYLSRVFDKVGVSDRFELAILALQGAVGGSALPLHSGEAAAAQRAFFVGSPKPSMVIYAAA